MNMENTLGNNHENIAERREKLIEGFGIVLCTKQKDGEKAELKDQINFAESTGLPAVQFDFRKRDQEEIFQSVNDLVKYREAHPDISISIHGETPRFDEVTVGVKNQERILREIDLLNVISGESYTVHPPSINQKLFNELVQVDKQKLIDIYCDTFVQSIIKAIEEDKQFSIAIENMPRKGDDGSYGQNVDDILSIINKIENKLAGLGVDSEVASKYLGATLDINHALHDVAEQEYVSVLEEWFKRLGGYLRVIHLYTPSQFDSKYQEKYNLCLDFASQFSPNARLFMESKQSLEVTRAIYLQTRE